MTRLIYSGLFDELPELKIISHHMGGMIPYFPAKIKLGFRQIFYGTIERNPAAERRDLKKPPPDYFKMLYADTAIGGEPAPTRCGHAFFGTTHWFICHGRAIRSRAGPGIDRRYAPRRRRAQTSRSGNEAHLWRQCPGALEAVRTKMKAKNITVKLRDGEMGAYLAIPDRVPAGAIIAIMEIWGVNDTMRHHAHEFAQAGFICLVPDLFWRQEPGVELSDHDPEHVKKAFDLYYDFDYDLAVRDMEDTWHFLQRLPECNGRVGAVGYCL